MELNPGRVRRKWLLRLSPVLREAWSFLLKRKRLGPSRRIRILAGEEESFSQSPDLLEPSPSTSVEALIPRAQ